MKARFLFLAAVMLGLASCQTEPEGLDVNVGGEEQIVTVNVNVPETETRAAGSDSALGVFDNGVLGTAEDNTTMRYILQVYYKDGENFVKSEERKVEYSDGKSVAFDVRLVPERDYQFVVWADVVVNGKTDTDNHYNTSDLTNVTLNNTWVAMDESRDAFTATEFIDNFNGSKDINITLKRPFAKLRVVTTDMKALNNLGIVPTKATVTYTEKHYGAFNAFAGKAINGSKNRDIKHENFAILSYGETGDNKTLFTDYFFAEDDATNFVLDVFDQNNQIIKSGEFTTDIYVKRNNLTTIKGNILTDGKGFDVIIDDAFAGESGKDDGKTFVKVDTAEEFNEAYVDEDIDLIILDANITLDEALTRATDPVLTLSKEKELTIDLNGYTLSSTSTQTGKNYNMFDVRGTLTVKNGNIKYEHKGDNMGWNNYAEIFYVGFDGTLNLDGVNAENVGGSDMAYVIDMVNATNINVNVTNSTLKTTYIPIRVFNNSKTGVNNVTIKNTTLQGKYCFWVQYWLADGRDEATLQNTLNIDIYNSTEGDSNNNTFTYNNAKNAPVLYGYNDAEYFDEFGNKMSFLTPIEGVEGVALDTEGNYVVTADEGLASLSALIAADENNFAGKTIVLNTDIDLAEVKTNGDSFAPIGSTGERDDRNRLICEPFKGTFDGNGKTIKNLYQSGWDMGYELGQYGSLGLFAELEGATVKNVVIEGLEAQVEGGDISFIAGSATGDCVFENITIQNSSIGTYNNGCGGIIGWSGAGTYTFKNITIAEDVVLGGLWGSFDSSIGGIVGQAEPGATYNFENVVINCRIDAYNDCTASYDYYLYRMCGMIVGRCEQTTTINGVNYPDLSKYNFSFNNVVVNYGTWMNYHYCEPTPGHNNGRGMRIEPGYAYGGLPEDFDHSQCVDNHYNCIPFDQLIGGAQLGVRGLREVDGVTVNYPAEYTCPLCGNQHNVQ